MRKKVLWLSLWCLGYVLVVGLVVRAEEKKDAAVEIAKMAQEEERAMALTPEQQKQVKALREEYKEKQKDSRASLKIKTDALKDALDSDKLERSKVDALAADVSFLQDKILKSRVDLVFKTREVLTLEQYKKLKEVRERKHEKKGEKKKGKK